MDINQLESHTYKPYEDELNNMHRDVLRMGGMVEKQLFDAIASIDEVDSGRAENVLAVEPEIDEAEMLFDEQCMQIIARRQPMATDLRSILGSRRCVGDLERVGDEAKKIAKMAIKLASEGVAPKGYPEVRTIGAIVAQMLNDALDAFSRMDVESALCIMDEDKEVDRAYKAATKDLIQYMAEDPDSISSLMNVVWILRSLERIGDHTKNICEVIVYIARGKDIRHGNRSNLKSE